MDPQQRLFIEVAWEALEDAGVIPEKLAGSRAGVFVGSMTSDYDDLQHYQIDQSTIDLHTTTGGYRSVIAGRLSYLLDLRGPSISIDTGCSASLVAVHLACQSILWGECPVALAAGTNLLIQPERSMGFASARMLAPDGRCKFADQRANGFVRSEGVGAVVLKPLAQAQADNDQIYAVILGSAVCNDGRTSDSMAAPGLEGQRELLRLAYERAGVLPGNVAYIEAHGTGTALGDRTELAVLSAVLGEGRPDGQRCLVGSVKSNIGHAEGAAGIAGLIKTALALKHRKIPPTLHAQTLNSHIDWLRASIAVPQALLSWPPTAEAAIAGVSSFSISGTNAHVVLQATPDLQETKKTERNELTELFTLSAASPEALRAMATQYVEFLAEKDTAVSLRDLCYTRNLRRTHHSHRLASAAESITEVREALSAFLRGDDPTIASGQISPERKKIVFVFPGLGPQWLGMGRELFQHEPAFREAMERCDQEFRRYSNWSLISELHADEAHSCLAQIDVVQYALFAMGVSLSALWRSWGIQPDAVVGHSMGEITAAHTAGILNLAQATRVMHARGEVLKHKTGLGGMAVVELRADEAESMLADYGRDVVVAGSNTRTSTLLSGSIAAIDRILSDLQQRGIFCRKVSSGYASHSPQMHDAAFELSRRLEGLSTQEPTIPFYSTVTGSPSKELVCANGYWARNLRQRVLFAQAVESLLRDAHAVFLEVSPHPVLLASIQQAIHESGHDALTLPSLSRKEKGLKPLYRSLGILYCSGCDINWKQFHSAESNCISLPAYPWQGERHWREGAHRRSPQLQKTGALPAAVTSTTRTVPDEQRDRASFRKELLAADAQQRQVLLETYFAQQMARVIQLPVSKIDTSRPLIKLGVDSLMAFELINRTFADVGVSLPVAKVMGARSIVHLAAHVLNQLCAPLAAAAAPASSPDLSGRPQIQEQTR